MFWDFIFKHQSFTIWILNLSQRSLCRRLLILPVGRRSTGLLRGLGSGYRLCATEWGVWMLPPPPASTRPGTSPSTHFQLWYLASLQAWLMDHATKAKTSETVNQNVSFPPRSCLPQVFCHSIGKQTNSQGMFILTHPNLLYKPGHVVPDPSGKLLFSNHENIL